MPSERWTTVRHVTRYLDRADEYPRRAEGESALLDHVPCDARRTVDLGTGDGRLLALLRIDRCRRLSCDPPRAVLRVDRQPHDLVRPRRWLADTGQPEVGIALGHEVVSVEASEKAQVVVEARRRVVLGEMPADVVVARENETRSLGSFIRSQHAARQVLA